MKSKPGPSHQTLQPPVGTLHLGISDDQATSQDVSSRLSTLTTDQPLTTSNESYPVANEFPGKYMIFSIINIRKISINWKQV